MLTKLFHMFMLLRRPMTLGVRAVIEDDAGRILLVRHTYVKGWYFPGGGVETGQTMHRAMAQELFEEVNIGDMGEVRLFNVYLNRNISKRDHVGLYICRNWSDRKQFVANNEIAEIGFFARDDLPEGTTNGTRKRLAEIFEGVEMSQEW